MNINAFTVLYKYVSVIKCGIQLRSVILFMWSSDDFWYKSSVYKW